MILFIAIISILGITGLSVLIKRLTGFAVCPICAGVIGTWLWILFGIYFDLLDVDSWPLVAAMAMGGSVVGIAYQIEKRPVFTRASAAELLFWKTFFIPAGFAAAYSIISFAVEPSNHFWRIASIALMVFLAVFVLLFMYTVGLRHNGRNRKAGALEGRISSQMRREELEKQMKNCC